MKAKALLTAALAGALAVDFMGLRQDYLPIRSWEARPAYYKWLEGEGPKEARLELPDAIPEYAASTAMYMAFSSDNPSPMVLGIGSVGPMGELSVQEWAHLFPERDSVRFFSALGVKRVMIHRDVLNETYDWKPADLADSSHYGLEGIIESDNEEAITLKFPEHEQLLNASARLRNFMLTLAFTQVEGSRYYFRRLGLARLKLVKSDMNAPPDGSFLLELNDLTGHYGAPRPGCRTALASGAQNGAVLTVPGPRVQFVVESCDGADIAAIMKERNLEKVYFDALFRTRSENPLEGISEGELESRGIVFRKRIGSVDVYEIVHKEPATSPPLNGKVSAVAGQTPGGILVEATVTVYSPEGGTWKNPNPGNSIALVCGLKFPDGGKSSEQRLDIYPDPVILSGHEQPAGVLKWTLPMEQRGNEAAIECSSGQMPAFSSRLLVQ